MTVNNTLTRWATIVIKGSIRSATPEEKARILALLAKAAQRPLEARHEQR